MDMFEPARLFYQSLLAAWAVVSVPATCRRLPETRSLRRS